MEERKNLDDDFNSKNKSKRDPLFLLKVIPKFTAVRTWNRDVWEIHGIERFYLAREVLQEFLADQPSCNAFQILPEIFSEASLEVKSLGYEYAAKVGRILGRAKIIGGTSSGLALVQDRIRNANPSVLIVEEAAEILEVNTIACMFPSVKQVILIGDHKQLRPTTRWFTTTKYQYDISLFERLIQ